MKMACLTMHGLAAVLQALQPAELAQSLPASLYASQLSSRTLILEQSESQA